MIKRVVSERIKNFNYENVELRPSHWENQRRRAIEDFLAIDNDALLRPFRTLAGFDTHSDASLDGWYGGSGGTFWQKISGFVKLYKVTGDYRLADKALYLADEWCKCADATEKIYDRARPYPFDKNIAGLLDLYLYLNYEKSIEHISKLTDAAIKNYPKDIKRDGVQNDGLYSRSMIEWYTLSEVLYRVYEITGDNKYIDLANEWDYTYYWNKLKNKDFAIGTRHAYSHVNCLSGAARTYLATGKEMYLDAIKAAYDEITTNHIYITGGYGPAESLYIEKEGYLGDALNDPWEMKPEDILYENFEGRIVGWSHIWGTCEVSCCSWATFKICNYLLTITGEAKYGDWAEKILYNCLGSQPPMQPNGKLRYYDEYYRSGGYKTVVDRRLRANGAEHNWVCCTGTFPQAMAEYSNMLYYSNDDGIYISQYLPSNLTSNINGVSVTIDNYSDFPLEEVVRLRIGVAEDVEFSLNLRVPSWANGNNTILVNGNLTNVNMKPNTWAVLNRKWSNNDTIEISFPFNLVFVPVDKKYQNIAALRYGPMVLVGDEMADFNGDMKKPDEWIEPIEGELYTFRSKPGYKNPYDFTQVTFKPYYSVPEHEWYYMYFLFSDKKYTRV